MIQASIFRWARSKIDFPRAGFLLSDERIEFLKFRTTKNAVLFDLWGRIELPDGIIVHGEIQQEDECIRMITSWVAREAPMLRNAFMTVGLPEEKGFVRVIQLPKVQREEIENAIRWEIEAHIPLSQEELVYDYEVVEPLDDGLDHIDIAIAAFPKKIAEAYTRVLKGAGLRIGIMELVSQAFIRAAVPTFRERSAKILIEIGQARTMFMVFAGGVIIFTTTVDVGGQVFEENIARALGNTREEAAQLKYEVGLNRLALDGAVFAALVPAIAALVDEARKAIEYYQEHVSHAHGAHTAIDAVLLGGEESRLKGLDTYFSSVLKIPAERIDPMTPIKEFFAGALPPLSRRQLFSYAATMGLALRGIR